VINNPNTISSTTKNSLGVRVPYPFLPLEVPTFLVFCETSSDEEKKQIEETMTSVAQKFVDKQKAMATMAATGKSETLDCQLYCIFFLVEFSPFADESLY